MTITDIIDSIYPASDASGTILSTQVWIIFDREIDENSVNEGNFFVEGPDTDSFIGPDMGLNLPGSSISDGNDQLETAGYRGIVPGTFTFEKIQVGEVSGYSGFDTEGDGGIWRTKVIFTPTYRLQKLTEYTVYISGDEDDTDGLSTGIRARSIFDTVRGLNTGDGEVEFTGTYTGNASTDTFTAKITTAGESDEAAFVWWRDTDPSTIYGPISTEEFTETPLDDGVSIEWGTGTFEIDDTFSVVVKTPTLFTGNMYWSFTTGAGSIQSVPTSTSTSITGDSTSTSTSTFSVLETSPIDQATNQLNTITTITATFNGDLAAVPTVTITAEPVIGIDDSDVGGITYSGVLVHTDSISGDTLTMELDPNQLNDNNIIVITIDGDAENTDGLTLGDDYVFWFTSRYSPMYSSIRKVRLEVGSFISTIIDDTVNQAIFEASMLAGQISWSSSTNDLFIFARREWTTCKAAQILLLNTLGVGGLQSKRLDNLSVTYDSKHGQDLLNKINECLATWEAQVISGGAATQTPAMVVKGEYDADAPNVGRMWEKDPFTPLPAGSNIRYRPLGSRRYIGGWRSRRF